MSRSVLLVPRVLLLAALVFSLLVAVPAPVDASTSAEQDFVQRLNQERAARGLHQLTVRSDLRSVARSHSATMASQDRLHHNPSLGSDVSNWQRLSENVGVGPSVGSLHTALMNSPGHRANILDRRVTEVGVGVVVRNGRIWVTQVFRLPRGATIPSGSSQTFPGGFSDVPRSSTHGRDIERLRTENITAGCGSNRYCPGRAVTREQMASFLVRAFDVPRSSRSRFRDVGGTHATDIRSLADAGITKGCNPPKNDRYCPKGSVTRAQMATFLVRALDLPATSGNRFRDVRGRHTAEINALARAGITKGCNPPKNDRFCPNDPVTRAQMASFLVRALQHH